MPKEFFARPSRTSRSPRGDNQVFGIFYEDADAENTWRRLEPSKRSRPLFLIKSPKGSAPVEEIAQKLNQGFDFLSSPSLGQGSVALADFQLEHPTRNQFSLACLSSSRQVQILDFAIGDSNESLLIEKSLRKAGRFSISIIATHPVSRECKTTSAWVRPAFIFRLMPMRSSSNSLSHLIGNVIRLRDLLNSPIPPSDVLSLPFFFDNFLASKLDLIKLIEAISTLEKS